MPASKQSKEEDEQKRKKIVLKNKIMILSVFVHVLIFRLASRRQIEYCIQISLPTNYLLCKKI